MLLHIFLPIVHCTTSGDFCFPIPKILSAKVRVIFTIIFLNNFVYRKTFIKSTGLFYMSDSTERFSQLEIVLFYNKMNQFGFFSRGKVFSSYLIGVGKLIRIQGLNNLFQTYLTIKKMTQIVEIAWWKRLSGSSSLNDREKGWNKSWSIENEKSCTFLLP